MRYEYTVIPAPAKGDKAKGAKTPTERYVLAFTAELNRMAAEGWDYVRAETLPSEERSGLTGRATVYHNMLVFRRPMAAQDSPPEAPAENAPAAAQPKATAPQKQDNDTVTVSAPAAKPDESADKG